ncbi:MAG TPA: hypothetical protein PLV32_12155 [Chitinophagaceae bacterium]|nr:hypothetical protein [Chitinophagaceae bacterium]
MKQLKKWGSTLSLCLIQVVMVAQDTVRTHTTTKTTATWYTQPWIWVVGAVLLLLVIIAMMRGSNSRAITKTTTVVKEEKT